MSFPVSSEQAVVAIAALETPSTLRNSRRLTPGFCVSWLMSVVAVAAVVASLLALARCDGRRRRIRRRLLLGITRGLQSFFFAVAVDVAAHAPAHVEARELVDAIHVLDLAVTRLAGHTRVHVARVWEVDVFRDFVNTHPRNGLGVRTHAGAHASGISILIQLLNLGAL